MQGYNHVLVISIILSSFPALLCRGGTIKDTASNFRTGKGLSNDQTTGRIKEAVLNVGTNDLNDFEENTDIFVEKPENQYERIAFEPKEIERHFREKREARNEVNNNKKSNEPRSDRKRSANKNSEKSVSKVDEDLQRLDEGESLDYDDLSADESTQELKDTDYSEDAIDDSPSAKKMAEYKRKDSRVVREDLNKFIDQDEGSSLYDDFEAKDVVKRGISGAEDYEEVEEDDDTSGTLEDAAAVQEEDSVNEEDEKSEEVRGDARVKREHGENSKVGNQLENIEVSVKEGDPLIENGGVKSVDDKAMKRDADKSEESAQVIQDKSVNKNENEVTQNSKRNVVDKQVNEDLKMNTDQVDASKQLSLTNDKSIKDESLEVQGDGKRMEGTDDSDDKKLVPDLLEENGSTKNEDNSKVADNTNLNDASKSQDVSVSNDAPKIGESESDAAKQAELNYEKRVEEEIQRKIDSIKEDIKREIEETQRVREIEKNNAKFDELRNQEDDDEDSEQSNEGERIEKRQSIKRPARSSDSSRARDTDQNQNRPIKRKKRQENVNFERNKNSVAAVNGKSQLNHEGIKKRSTNQFRRSKMLKRMAAQSAPSKKKEYVRRAILVKNENGGGKKRRRRRRRARNLNLLPEQGRVKIQDKIAADVNLDPGLRKVLGDGKTSSSLNAGGEKREAEQNSRRKADLTTSLTGSSPELNPRLANDYKEAFGGHQGESGVALARFKRIKRVLRAPSMKT